MIKKYIQKVANKIDLSIDESKEVLNYILSDKASEAQIATFLTLLNLKGESIDELTGFASAILSKTERINFKDHKLFDCCGTGGDMASTINISTAVAIMAAASGVCIAKHSNKSITSQSGSSDVLSELKIPLCTKNIEVERNLKKNNIAFLHAPSFHTATHKVAKIRRDMGIRTVFNLLGPLTNPAILTGQLVGVSDPLISYKFANSLRNLGIKKALIVCADKPRLDELSLSSTNIIYELKDNQIKNYMVDPQDFGFKHVPIENVKGSDPKSNARVISDIFQNKIDDSRRDIIMLNAAALLWVADLAENINDALDLLKQNLESGLVYEKYRKLRIE